MPCPRSLRRKPILAPGLFLLLGDLDLAALRLAVVGGGLRDALALAAVLALAGVARALARAVALALVDARAPHFVAGLLGRLVLRERRSREEHRGDGGGKDGILHRHGFSFRESGTARMSTPGAGMRYTRFVGRQVCSCPGLRREDGDRHRRDERDRRGLRA